MQGIAIQTGHIRYFRRAALLLCALLLTGCSEQPLRLGIQNLIGDDVIRMARQWQWIGPDVELVETESGADALEALASGELHAACLTLDEAIRGLDRGLPLSVVLVIDISSGADSLLARPDITSIGDLRGRRIALQASSVNLLMLAAALQSADLGLGDVELIDVEPPQLADLWRAGTIDAASTHEPFARILRAQGARGLMSSRDTPELIFDVIVVNRNAMAGRERTLKKLVSAVLDAQAHVHDNPVDAVYRLASLRGQSVSVTEEALRRIVIPTHEAQHAYFARNSRLADAARRIDELFVDARILAGPTAGLTLFDPRFLPEPAS